MHLVPPIRPGCTAESLPDRRARRRSESLQNRPEGIAVDRRGGFGWSGLAGALGLHYERVIRELMEALSGLVDITFGKGKWDTSKMLDKMGQQRETIPPVYIEDLVDLLANPTNNDPEISMAINTAKAPRGEQVKENDYLRHQISVQVKSIPITQPPPITPQKGMV